MPQDFDVIVIGGGPAGEVIAGRCAAEPLSVAVVERRLVGGECSYYGCMPSKALLRPGDVLDAARRVPGAREAVSRPVDTVAALRRRDEITGNWDDSSQAQWLDDRAVTLVRGHGRLSGPRSVVVDNDEGNSQTLTARVAVVLATGSSPVVPPVPGLREMRVWDNRDATAGKEVPRRLLVLGGGAVGVELAQAWHALGTDEVTVVERAPRLLVNEDPVAGEVLREALIARGIAVVTGVGLASAQREAPDAPVTATLEDGTEIVADEILVAAGRRPNTVGIGLETVGLEPGRAVEVDDHLRVVGVPAPWLYAIGDVNGVAALTHMGKYQARIAAENIAGREATVEARNAVPRVIFTDPAVAAVGLTEAQARDQGMRVRVLEAQVADVAASAFLGLGTHGPARLVVDDDRDVIVGALFIGPGFGDLLHAATIAIVGEVPLQRLHHAVPAFPTVSEVWLKLLEADERRTAR